jgi:hypothetical protein
VDELGDAEHRSDEERRFAKGIDSHRRTTPWFKKEKVKGQCRHSNREESRPSANKEAGDHRSNKEKGKRCMKVQSATHRKRENKYCQYERSEWSHGFLAFLKADETELPKHSIHSHIARTLAA